MARVPPAPTRPALGAARTDGLPRGRRALGGRPRRTVRPLAGLAPATLPASGADPDEAARSALAHLLRHGWYDTAGASLGLVAAARSADIPAVIGWRAEAPLPLFCALLRSWEDRFGARVLAAIGATLYVSVACPPRTQEQADLVALEHLLTTADNIVNDPPTPFPRYAASLIDAPVWSFWWD
ncbi:DUF4253 domain-containing protein [Streptomyces sp. NPDC086182]|jgi:hypothetical protein|uniref:DUF4253 domain-containing protein n=1 Tax=Streptomyces sp. NPDC086182 TaxID=3155058 RepID=UPI0034229190